jgi:hypothetical protein
MIGLGRVESSRFGPERIRASMAVAGCRVQSGRGSSRRAGRRGHRGRMFIREAPSPSSCGGGQRGSCPITPPRELGPVPDNRTGIRDESARSSGRPVFSSFAFEPSQAAPPFLRLCVRSRPLHLSCPNPLSSPDPGSPVTTRLICRTMNRSSIAMRRRDGLGTVRHFSIDRDSPSGNWRPVRQSRVPDGKCRPDRVLRSPSAPRRKSQCCRTGRSMGQVGCSETFRDGSTRADVERRRSGVTRCRRAGADV